MKIPSKKRYYRVLADKHSQSGTPEDNLKAGDYYIKVKDPNKALRAYSKSITDYLYEAGTRKGEITEEDVRFVNNLRSRINRLMKIVNYDPAIHDPMSDINRMILIGAYPIEPNARELIEKTRSHIKHVKGLDEIFFREGHRFSSDGGSSAASVSIATHAGFHILFISISFILAFILLSPSITGFTILDFNNKSQNFFGIIIFIIGVYLTFIYIFTRSKYKN